MKSPLSKRSVAGAVPRGSERLHESWWSRWTGFLSDRSGDEDLGSMGDSAALNTWCSRTGKSDGCCPMPGKEQGA